jgi:hypothetical protein
MISNTKKPSVATKTDSKIKQVPTKICINMIAQTPLLLEYGRATLRGPVDTVQRMSYLI